MGNITKTFFIMFPKQLNALEKPEINSGFVQTDILKVSQIVLKIVGEGGFP